MWAEGAQPLRETLAAKKGAIVTEWLTRTLRTYPEQTCRFLSQEKDPFRNPVGHVLAEALPALFDQAVQGPDAALLPRLLDPVVRMRAVQDFSAAQAVAFLFLLKQVIREALHSPPQPPLSPGGGADNGEGVAPGESLAALDARIDQMALLAFDLFMRCREQLYEIRAREARRRFEVLLRRAGLRGGSGETENRGNGEAGAEPADPPGLGLAHSPIRDWKEP